MRNDVILRRRWLEAGREATFLNLGQALRIDDRIGEERRLHLRDTTFSVLHEGGPLGLVLDRGEEAHARSS